MMITIDNFIDQLILCGLADYSFIDLINKHYLKVLSAYNVFKQIEEHSERFEANMDSDDDTLTVSVFLKDDVDGTELITSSDDLEVQVIKENNMICISVMNSKFESEDDIYEDRFARCKEVNRGEWS